MSFALTEEQKEFQGVLRSFLRETVTSEYFRSQVGGHAALEKRPSDLNLWRKLAELGLPESFGASGTDFSVGFRELSLLAFECGAALLPEPLLEVSFFGPYLFSRILSDAERAQAQAFLGDSLFEELCCGNVHGSVALTQGPAFTLSSPGAATSFGSAPTFLGAPESPLMLVLERTSASNARLILIKSQGGVASSFAAMLDPSLRAFRAEVKNAPCLVLEGQVASRTLQLFHTLRATEMAGACTRAVEMTVDFVKTREQFGVPIGGFQAVQHRLADMFLQSEALGAISRFAAWAADNSPEQLPLASASALSQACEQAGLIVEGAIQLHGGIGFTYEYDLHFFLRRVKCLEALYRFTEEELCSLISLAA